MQLTARLKIPYADLNGDDSPVDIPQVWYDRAIILDGLAPISEGPLSGRPVSTAQNPGVVGRFYITTDQVDSPRLDMDTGTAWITTGPAQIDAGPAVPSLRTLGTGAQQAAAGNDPRLIGGGNASGDIGGTYPGPLTVNTWNGQTKGQVVASNPPQSHAGSHAPGGGDPVSGLTDASIAATNKDGAANLPSMRTLGSGAQQAMPGNANPTPGAHANSHKYTGADPLTLLKPTPQNANYAAVVGDLVLMTGSNNTVTLPNAPSVDGAQCAVMAITTGVTVNRAGTDTITTSAQGQLTVTVAQGTTVVFTYHSGVWYGIVSGAGGGASGLVALSPPSRAYQTAAVSAVSGVATKIPFDTKSYDTTGAFDVTTNHRYIVPSAGYYNITGQVLVVMENNPQQLSLQIYKNGTSVSVGSAFYPRGSVAGTDQWGLTVDDTIQCNAGDYLELFLYSAGGTATPLSNVGSPSANYVAITQVAQTGSPPPGQGLATQARAYRNTILALAANTWTKIPLDSISFDPGSSFSLPNSRYVCPATGYYQVNATASIQSGASTVGGGVAIYKNGAMATSGNILLGAAVGSGSQEQYVVSDVVYCQAGDYLELWAWTNAAVNCGYGPTNTWMSVAQVGGANLFGALSPTAQSAPYTAGAGQLVLMTGANAVTLPNAPIPGSQVEVLALTAAVPVNRTGTDTINNSGVAGLQSLTVQAGQSTIFSYLGGVWYTSPVGGGQVLAPPARVHKSSAAFNGVTGWTKVPFEVKDYDPGGNYDATTNFRYNVPIAGFYHVSAELAIGLGNNPQQLALAVYKNGTNVSIGDWTTVRGGTNGDPIFISLSDTIQCNAGDYLEVYLYNNGASAVALDNAPSSFNNYLAIHQIGTPVGSPPAGQGFSTQARAYRNAAFNAASGVWQMLPVDAVSFDPGNNISISNGRYICPATGWYQVSVGVGAGSTAAGQTLVAGLYKNGNSVTQGSASQSAASGLTMAAELSDIVYCQAGDYLQPAFYINAALAMGVGSTSCYISVTQVGGTNLVGALSPTVQSADYAAGAGQSVLMTGAHTVTLPNSPMNGSVEEIVAENGNVTVNRSGTNTITQGATTGLLTLTVLSGKASTLRYLNGVWHVVSMVSLT